QLRRGAAEPTLDLTDDRMAILFGPRPGDHRQGQPVLRVVGDVIPVVPAVIVGRAVGIAVLLLLADEGPLLIELDLAGTGGKSPRARRGRPRRGDRRGAPVG